MRLKLFYFLIAALGLSNVCATQILRIDLTTASSTNPIKTFFCHSESRGNAILIQVPNSEPYQSHLKGKNFLVFLEKDELVVREVKVQGAELRSNGDRISYHVDSVQMIQYSSTQRAIEVVDSVRQKDMNPKYENNNIIKSLTEMLKDQKLFAKIPNKVFTFFGGPTPIAVFLDTPQYIPVSNALGSSLPSAKQISIPVNTIVTVPGPVGGAVFATGSGPISGVVVGPVPAVAIR